MRNNTCNDHYTGNFFYKVCPKFVYCNFGSVWIPNLSSTTKEKRDFFLHWYNASEIALRAQAHTHYLLNVILAFNGKKRKRAKNSNSISHSNNHKYSIVKIKKYLISLFPFFLLDLAFLHSPLQFLAFLFPGFSIFILSARNKTIGQGGSFCNGPYLFLLLNFTDFKFKRGE